MNEILSNEEIDTLLDMFRSEGALEQEAQQPAAMMAPIEAPDGRVVSPVDLLKPVLDEMQQTGSSATSRRPWLGVSSTEQSGRIQIIRVNKDSPAQQAGLQPGDLVLAVDGTTVATLEAFYKKLWARSDPDAEVTLTVLQGAELKTIRIRAVDRMRTMVKPSGI